MIDLLFGFAIGAFGILSVEEGRRAVRRMLRLRLSIPGCCDMCHGTGAGDRGCPGGCWDCQATGHPHTGLCTWDRNRTEISS